MTFCPDWGVMSITPLPAGVAHVLPFPHLPNSTCITYQPSTSLTLVLLHLLTSLQLQSLPGASAPMSSASAAPVHLGPVRPWVPPKSYSDRSAKSARPECGSNPVPLSLCLPTFLLIEVVAAVVVRTWSTFTSRIILPWPSAPLKPSPLPVHTALSLFQEFAKTFWAWSVKHRVQDPLTNNQLPRPPTSGPAGPQISTTDSSPLHQSPSTSHISDPIPSENSKIRNSSPALCHVIALILTTTAIELVPLRAAASVQNITKLPASTPTNSVPPISADSDSGSSPCTNLVPPPPPNCLTNMSFSLHKTQSSLTADLTALQQVIAKNLWDQFPNAPPNEVFVFPTTAAYSTPGGGGTGTLTYIRGSEKNQPSAVVYKY
ncbi:hypothetical protein PTTG_07918 [Puccinia triticina 1-1 BBBD Race 1]|uniref:Uncharacterized protein n=1 Tax=Puccinia triticina (isolate 1-1 / race 1 (BBBD)) TaxID=630390 RepID=A0A180GZ81_PUCT1|nr:hypothetical protein PTTG_07918 [Puccinia triticina 1-1 BBBD Race 1]